MPKKMSFVAVSNRATVLRTYLATGNKMSIELQIVWWEPRQILYSFTK